MDQIYQHVEDIVTLAEVQDGFFEIEVTVLVRRKGGTESDFIRMQLENFNGGTRQLTVKQSRSDTALWF
ncbi:hypothetical protein ACQKIK_10350 [Pseudomonas sp. NPDC047961]